VIWWISGGVVAVALAVLALSIGGMVGSLRQFRFALRSLEVRVKAGQDRLAPGLAMLQERVEALQEPMRVAEGRALILQARRGDDD
jgi:hypothetical protein